MRKFKVFPMATAILSIALANTVGRAEEPASTKDWSEQQVAKLPASEKPVHLFNGKDFTGCTNIFELFLDNIPGRVAIDS